MAPPEKIFHASSSSKVDFISSLPENIRAKILTYLPIKEAARTSVLSSTWKNTWTSIPELKFGDFGFPYSPAFEKMVDVILLEHSGPIYKFHLVCRALCYYAFNRWIRYLSRNGIREIKLVFGHGPMYEIDSSFFSCDNLISVFLENCSVEIPMGFKEFKFLRILQFRNVSISDDSIKKLISCCPMLEDLILYLGYKCTIVDIQSPNLKYFDVSGYAMAFYLHTPNLLTLKEDLDADDEHFQFCKMNPQQVFGGGNLEMITTGPFIMKYLAYLHESGEFPMMFYNLKNLSIWFGDDKEAAAVLCLLRRTPNLEELDMKISGYHDFWESVNGKYFSFERLRFVNISLANELEDVISFVKFVLDSTPELLELTIHVDNFEDNAPARARKQLFKLPRASSKAQIIIKDIFRSIVN